MVSWCDNVAFVDNWCLLFVLIRQGPFVLRELPIFRKKLRKKCSKFVFFVFCEHATRRRPPACVDSSQCTLHRAIASLAPERGSLCVACTASYRASLAIALCSVHCELSIGRLSLDSARLSRPFAADCLRSLQLSVPCNAPVQLVMHTSITPVLGCPS